MTPPAQDPEGRSDAAAAAPANKAMTGGPEPPERTASWMEKAAAVVYCIFCIEIGLFLLVYPWLRSWEQNYLIQFHPALTGFLTSVQLRGAVSGLGILNLFAAVSEIRGLRRYSSR
jgi:hypothetical protein